MKLPADIPLVGGKNASLGELIQQLAPRGISVPMDWDYILCLPVLHQASGLEEKLRSLL